MPFLNAPDKYRYSMVLYHVAAWLIYISFAVVNSTVIRKMPFAGPLDILVTYLPSIYVFYGNLLIAVNFLTRRRIWFFLLMEIIFFLSYAVISYFIFYKLGPLVRDPNEKVPPFELYNHLLNGLWIFFTYSYFSLGYYFARSAIKRQIELRNTEREKLQSEQRRLEAEYAFLRAQINPHFLHNTLNFFYAKSLGTSKELSDGILTLCEIMRYSLSSGEDEQGNVLLSKEVEHVQHVIRINQMRFSHRLQVEFAISGDVETIRIVPLVLITLVENALKHGDITNAAHPLIIKLAVDEDGRQLHFSTYNKKKKGPKELSHGIGMENIRKRLSSAYKDNCHLNIMDGTEDYTVVLSINFEEGVTSAPNPPPRSPTPSGKA